MNVARPARSLFGKCVASTRTSAGMTTTTRPTAATAAAVAVAAASQFHTSTAPRSKRRMKARNVKAQELGLLDPQKLDKYREDKFGEYTAADLAALSTRYTAQQMEAIKAGEAAVDAEDLIFQGRLRDDPFRPTYLEDYTTLDPRFDVKPEETPRQREVKWLDASGWADEYGSRMVRLTGKKTSDQLTRAMARALRRVKESQGEEMIDLTEEELADLERDPDLLHKYLMEDEGEGDDEGGMTVAQAQKLDEAVDAAWRRELEQLSAQPDATEVEPSNLELIEDGPAGSVRQHSAEAPELGKVPGVEGLYKSAADAEDEGHDDDGRYQEIKRLTGMSLRDIQSVYRKVLVTRWVSNQTRLGKVRSTSVVAIAGNGNGRLGLGIAKSTEAGLAAETAQLLAIRNMKPVRRYENRTIYGTAKAKVSATVVELYARPPGFGLRVPHRIFEMCRAAGIHDIASNMPRAKNPMNSVKATYAALMGQIDPEEIAVGRGKKMVDVRKVYYGGSVH